MTTPSFSDFDQLSAQLRQEFVTTLVASGAIHSPALEQAFLTIPREVFVPSFFEKDETRETMAWTSINRQETPPDVYLAKVYGDQPLVTKIDARQMPVSSSSLPSVMAKMLEALTVAPGQRVLEVGTGTGYNAAILAMLTGHPSSVVSIEHDPLLAARAADAIERVVGPGMHVITGDGYAGHQESAPFDRILATASVPTVPLAWVQQLQPGGMLVMDLQGSLASGFLLLERTAEGARGRFLPGPLYFMPLVTPEIAASPLTRSPGSSLSSFVQEDHRTFPGILFEVSFRWFLQWRIAGCQIQSRRQLQRSSNTMLHTLCVIDPSTGATVEFQQHTSQSNWEVKTYGSSLIWDHLGHAYEEFLALGEPQSHQYGLLIEDEQITLTIGDLQLPLVFK